VSTHWTSVCKLKRARTRNYGKYCVYPGLMIANVGSDHECTGRSSKKWIRNQCPPPFPRQYGTRIVLRLYSKILLTACRRITSNSENFAHSSCAMKLLERLENCPGLLNDSWSDASLEAAHGTGFGRDGVGRKRLLVLTLRGVGIGQRSREIFLRFGLLLANNDIALSRIFPCLFVHASDLFGEFLGIFVLLDALTAPRPPTRKRNILLFGSVSFDCLLLLGSELLLQRGDQGSVRASIRPNN